MIVNTCNPNIAGMYSWQQPPYRSPPEIMQVLNIGLDDSPGMLDVGFSKTWVGYSLPI